MLSYHKTFGDKIETIENLESNCWVNCVLPSKTDINYLMCSLGIEPDILKASLDLEETSHIDKENENILIIIDSPVVNKTDKNFTYYTNPVSIIITSQNIITICLEENSIIEEFSEGIIKHAYPENKTRFALQIMMRMAIKYLQYINQIIKITDRVEKKLKKDMKNEGIIQLLEIKKSLVYFSSSLKSINGMIGKISRGKHLVLSADDIELLEDVSTEIKQASEMSETYLNIITSSMDAFSSLISNDLNVVMKILASITLILSIPTIVSGIYGMNNPGIPFMDDWWFPFALMIGCIVITWVILKRKDMI